MGHACCKDFLNFRASSVTPSTKVTPYFAKIVTNTFGYYLMQTMQSNMYICLDVMMEIQIFSDITYLM